MARSLNRQATSKDDLAVLYSVNGGRKIEKFPKNYSGLSAYGRRSSSP